MIFDLSILLAAFALMLLRRDNTNTAVALWLTCYLGYTFSFVGKTGSYVDFYILGAISVVVAFLYTTQSRRLNILERLTALLMYAPFVYNVGMANEWLSHNYGVFDALYTPFMKSIYVGMILSSNLTYAVTKATKFAKRAAANTKERHYHDALGTLAVGRYRGPKHCNGGSLFLHTVSHGKISKPNKI